MRIICVWEAETYDGEFLTPDDEDEVSILGAA